MASKIIFNFGVVLFVLFNCIISPVSAEENLGCPSPGVVFETNAVDGWNRLTSTGGRGWVCGFRDADGDPVGVYAQVFKLSSPFLAAAIEPIRGLWPLSVGKAVEFSFNMKNIGGNRTLRCVTREKKSLKTKAGGFDTFVIECGETSPEKDTGFGLQTYWYAPALGFIVKSEKRPSKDSLSVDEAWIVEAIRRENATGKPTSEDHGWIDRIVSAAIAEGRKMAPHNKDRPATLSSPQNARVTKIRAGWTIPDVTHMVLVPAGPFPLGDRYGDGEDSEHYTSTVELRAFYIDAYETTVGQYLEFTEKSGYGLPRFSNYPEFSHKYQPVVGVSALDADAYCKWAGKRLPTELEWEKAARGGKPIRYSWGDEEPERNGVHRANLGDGRTAPQIELEFARDGFVFPAPVGSFPLDKSTYGMIDAVGNVSEWTATYFEHTFYRKIFAAGGKPFLIEPRSERTARGGSWTNGEWTARTTARIAKNQRTKDMATGFRCAAGPESKVFKTQASTN